MWSGVDSILLISPTEKAWKRLLSRLSYSAAAGFGCGATGALAAAFLGSALGVGAGSGSTAYSAASLSPSLSVLEKRRTGAL